jgi:hypothetical protein
MVHRQEIVSYLPFLEPREASAAPDEAQKGAQGEAQEGP